MTVADRLREKAEDYRALGEEHATHAAGGAAYKLIEVVLREVADAVEAEEDELEREAA